MPLSGTVFVSVSDRDKRAIILPVLRLQQLGYDIAATEGTAEVLRRNGIGAREVLKFSDKPTADAASVVELIHRGEVDVVINTPERPLGPGRRLRDPRRRGRRRHPALHDDRRALGRRRLARRGARRVRGDEPAGVRRTPGGGDERMNGDSVIPFGERLGVRVRGLRPPVPRHRPARLAARGVGPARLRRGRARVRPARRRGRGRPGRHREAAGRVLRAARRRRLRRARARPPRGARRRPARDRRREARRHRLHASTPTARRGSDPAPASRPTP